MLWSIGGGVRVGRRHEFEFAVVEDEVVHDAAPDVSFHLAWRIDL